MDAEKFLNALEDILKEVGMQTAVLEGAEPQIGNTLRALLPVTDAGDVVLTEVMMGPCTEDALLLQLYSTMIMEIGPGYEALKEMLLDWNLTAQLGAFGIYRQQRQLYHKYNYIIPIDADPEEMAEEIFYLMKLVLTVISERFPDAVRLSGHQ